MTPSLLTQISKIPAAFHQRQDATLGLDVELSYLESEEPRSLHNLHVPSMSSGCPQIGDPWGSGTKSVVNKAHVGNGPTLSGGARSESQRIVVINESVTGEASRESYVVSSVSSRKYRRDCVASDGHLDEVLRRAFAPRVAMVRSAGKVSETPGD